MCCPWACGMKHLFVYWWFSSGIMRILLKVSEPIQLWTTLLRHPAQLLHVTVPFFVCESVLIVRVQFAIKCAIYVAIPWDQYNICWSIDSRAQMANRQCSVWLSITLSLLLNRGLQQVNSANRMNSSASLSLSQRKLQREGEMDGWCCALAV